MSAAEVDVVLPVLDEAAALPWVLGRVPPGHRAIVVDNGSTDGSGDVARAHGATVVVEPRRGFGAAGAAGLAGATATVVAFCDADASLDPTDLPSVVTPVVAGEADLVLGARRPTEAGAWPRHARIANRYLARRLRRATGAPLTDLGPMRAARREALLALGVEDRRFGFPLEMVLRAGAASWRIAEVPVPYARRTGRSKVTGTVRGTARAVRDMRRVLRDARPEPFQAPVSQSSSRM
jgi:glycosyltransferase involved in cell wall biosynthesis